MNEIRLLWLFTNLLLFSSLHAAVKRYEFSDLLMGTEFRILLYAHSDSLANAAAAKAFIRIRAIEASLSDYREDSEINQLAALAGMDTLVRVSEDLWKVLSYSLVVADKSGGAFDVTAGALTKLWRRAFRHKEMPAQEEINAAIQTIGHQYVKMDDGRVRLLKPGMRLDMGGIAKGYAVDEAMIILKEEGIAAALVDGGGDIAASDPPPGQMGWSIDRYIYQNGELWVEPMLISNQAVATSGDTYRYLEHEGKRYSHIIDPRTGMGISFRQIVTVVGPTCMEADAWATALSIGADPKLVGDLGKEGIVVHFSIF